MSNKEKIFNCLKKTFGFNEFKGPQEDIILNITESNNTFVIMPTGGGKSLCYQLPALLLEGTAIVISPLIALMKNQVDAIRGFSEEDSIAHVLNSSLTSEEISQVKKDLTEKKTKLLYLAPESFSKSSNIEFLKSINISFLAVDEAHCISEWGHDFRPEYRNIKSVLDQINSKTPIIALTATATPKVQSDILKNLEISECNFYFPSHSTRMLGDLNGANATTLGTGSGNSARVDSSTISGCLFINTEGEALVIKGNNNTVRNSYFRNIDWSATELNGLMVTVFVDGENNTFTENEIYFTGASATVWPGEESIFSYNIVIHAGN